jgi:hypothetical protein
VDVAEAAEHDGETDPGKLVGDDRPRDGEDIGVQGSGDRRERDDEHARREAGDELPEHRVDEEQKVGAPGHPRRG